MNTQEFLERILPRQGVYFAVYKQGPSSRWEHRPFSNVQELATAVQQLNKNCYAVYHACSSFKQAKIISADGKKTQYRTVDNCAFARSFWLDLDVGDSKAKDGKGYTSQKEACQALAGFCKKYKLPAPMLVSSGYGVHVYFVMDKDIPSEEWCATAAKLKALLYKEKVWADPSRTADSASILRPVGTDNKKHKTPAAVRVLFSQQRPIAYDAFKAIIDEATKDLAVQRQGKRKNLPEFTEEPADPSVKKLWDSSFVKDLTIKADADMCCEGCEQMRHMRDTKGDVNYKTLCNVVNVLRFCKDGYRLAHEWTANRLQNHDQGPEAINRLWDTLGADYATGCDKFEQDNPEPCLRCPNRGKIYNPTNLGNPTDAQLVEAEIHESKPEAVSESFTEGFGTATASEEEVEGIPGYYWGGDDVGMVRIVEGKKNSPATSRVFCKRNFKVVDRTIDEFGREAFVFTAKDLNTGQWKSFTLAGAQCAPGKLIENLFAYGVAPASGLDAEADMKAYVKDQIANIQRRVSATTVVSHFGWQNDGSFVIGPRMYCKGQKTPSIVLLDDATSRIKRLFPAPRGAVKSYAKAINEVYNQAGMEPFQYAICSVWGSVLVHLCNSEYKGIPIALTGTESGMGKTTAARAAFYAFGDSDAMMTSGFEGATQNALTKRLALLQNLPIFLDEMTDGSDTEYSRLLYQLANGSERDRLNRDASNKDKECWRSQSFITGNTSITELLSAKNANRSAQQMRIFEISIDEFTKTIPKLDTAFVPARLTRMGENMGIAGETFIQYLVGHVAEVKERLSAVIDPTKNPDCRGDLFTESQARYLRYHIACTLVAAEVMHQLGVISFNLKKLREFAISYGQIIVANTLSKRMNPIDIVLAILDENAAWGVVTSYYGTNEVDMNAKMPFDKFIKYRSVQTLNNKPANQYDNKLIIRIEVIRKWLTDHRQGTLESLKGGLGKTFVGREKLSLGKGILNAGGNRAWCWILDLTAVLPDLYGDNK